MQKISVSFSFSVLCNDSDDGEEIERVANFSCLLLGAWQEMLSTSTAPAAGNVQGQTSSGAKIQKQRAERR